ncbi:cyclic GMP-AMP synthase-like receptor isoform X4 [Mytilus edulis]|uniref:cyclic GMP-AMP synthase-like receptor isoform X4 n=1 Tax=Mytilus edulis TaxID=6550 RepID=UPI0039EF7540
MKKCDICFKDYKGDAGIRIHKSKAHKDEPLGGASTKDKHSKTKTAVQASYGDYQTKDFKFKCKFCDKRTETETGLRIHHGIVHKGTTYPEPSSTDEKGSRTKSVQDAHGGNHADDLLFKCKFCDKTSQTERGLKIHHGRVHLGTTYPEPSSTDQKGSGTKSVPDAHGGNHTDDLQFNCKFCDKTSQTERGLKIHHGRVHQDKDFPGHCYKNSTGSTAATKDPYAKSVAKEELLRSPSVPLDMMVKIDKATVTDQAIDRLSDQLEECKMSKKDSSAASEAMNSFTDSFLTELNKISKLKWFFFNSGSFYDKTRNSPDEFDLMIYPDVQVSVDFDDKSVLGFYKVKMVSTRVPELDGTVTRNDYIRPEAYKTYVFELFDRVLQKIREGRRVTKRVKSRNSPAYTIDYKAIPGKKAIDVDLVPCFKIEGWPPVAKRLDPKWISYDSVVHNAMKSCDIVCKKCPHDHPDNNLLWRLSFAKAEKMLMKHANSSGDSTFKKDAYRFIKLYICNMKDQFPGKIQKFSSYCIKQFIFTEFDNWPKKPTEEVIIQRNILKHLIEGLEERCIPNYFLQNDNVLQFIPTDELNLLCRGMKMEYEKLLGKKRSK